MQLPYNVIDRRFHNSGWINRLSMSGVEVHVRSVFLQGLLLMRTDQIPSWFGGHDQALIEWHDYLRETKSDPVEVCLNYVLDSKVISGVVVGVDSSEQIAKLVAISSGKSSPLTYQPSEVDQYLVDPRLWKRN